MVSTAIILATTGLIPSPAWISRLAGQLTAERYPCEGGQCACASARTCWTTCQCHTLEQKVRWAKREGVRIPEFVDLSNLDMSKDVPSKPACPLCAGYGEDEDEAGTAQEDEEGLAESPSRLPTLTPLGCRGIELLLAFAAVTGLNESTEVVVIDATTTEPRCIPCTSQRRPQSTWLDVPTPPPRRA